MAVRVLGVVLGVMAAAQVAADTLDLNLHGDALRATYSRGIGAGRGLDLDAGYLYAKNPAQTDHLLHVGLQVAGQNWSKQGNFDIGLGGRAVFVDTKPGNSAAIAFGGQVRFSPLPRVGFGGSLFYAPKITSFLDGEGYLEWSAAADYQLLTQAFVYVGYRKVETDIKNAGTYTVDDNLHVGMRLTF
jgi:hypothetical protein